MAEIFEKNEKKTTKKHNFKITRKNTLESVKMKNSKIGLRHVLSGPKLCLESKFNDPGTFGCFGEHEQTHTPSRYNTEMSHFQNGRCHHL